MTQPLFIGANDVGLQRNLEPFMIPEKAFPVLENAFVFRGRVEKKFGYKSLGRLARDLTAAPLTLPVTTVQFNIYSTLTTPITGQPNAQIEPGSVVITFNTAETFTDNGTGVLVASIGGDSGIINYATGNVTLTFAGAPASATITFTYFPMLPVMGITLRELTTLNFFQTVAFDTIYAYTFNGTSWGELPSTTPLVSFWTGSDSQFFWTTNYGVDTTNADLFWATNFKDNIRYYDGTKWNNFTPLTNTTDTVTQALIILPYKDRLLFMNTIENVGGSPNQTFPQRVRWSQNSSANGSTVIDVNAWRDDQIGRGGFVDAPTNEQIVSAGFVKDTLVVYFERSTWQLAYTSNPVLPFIWQRINSELGAESTFSFVGFDNALVAWGTAGIHSSNGVSCERIDAIIPDEAFTVNNDNDGTLRVYGIRDYLNELAYFTYPDKAFIGSFQSGTFRYPNRVLVYNYRNDTWSFFRENFTCYGYFQLGDPLTWADLIIGSGHAPWSAWQDPWNSNFEEGEMPLVAAGNQQGFIFLLGDDSGANADQYAITTLTGSTVGSPNHNLNPGEFVYIENAIGAVNLNNQTWKVESCPDNNTFIVNATVVGTYLGGGTIRLLSNVDIETKMFNPFWQIGRRHRLRKCDFLFPRTEDGAIAVDIFVDTAQYSVTDFNPSITPSILGTNMVSTAPEPDIRTQQSQQFIWHHTYPQVDGDTFQLKFTLTDAQMVALDLEGQPRYAEDEFALHGIVMYFDPAEEFL